MRDYYPVICGSKLPAKVLCAVLAVALLMLAAYVEGTAVPPC